MPKSLAEHLAEVRRAIPVGDHSARKGATAAITDAVDLSEYRPITPHETAVLTAMLHSGGAEALAFLPQLEGMMVKDEECACGCPSLIFAPPPDGVRLDRYRQRIVAEMYGQADDPAAEAGDGMMGLLLWQAGGKLTGLEVYDLSFRPEGHPFPLPIIESLYV